MRLLLTCVALLVSRVEVFTTTPFEASSKSVFPLRVSSLQSTASPSVVDTGIEKRFYQHQSFRICYLFKDGDDSVPPLFLIHPVGIGCSSWVWRRLMPLWPGKVYAPDLIGCGIAHGSDSWDPTKQMLSFPDSWVDGCESLLKEKVMVVDKKNPLLRLAARPILPAIVVAQGGLAPVGLLLASRNPDQIQQLVLTSPPTYDTLLKPVPRAELDRNYGFLKSSLGQWAFRILESRFNIEFFSNQFLFAQPCDREWLDECEQEGCEQARPPIQAFNAGLCLSRSFVEELESLKQPLLVLQGETETQRRQRGRDAFREKVPDCEIQTLPGKNILAWEGPGLVADAISSFLASRQEVPQRRKWRHGDLEA